MEVVDFWAVAVEAKDNVINYYIGEIIKIDQFISRNTKWNFFTRVFTNNFISLRKKIFHKSINIEYRGRMVQCFSKLEWLSRKLNNRFLAIKTCIQFDIFCIIKFFSFWTLFHYFFNNDYNLLFPKFLLPLRISGISS